MTEMLPSVNAALNATSAILLIWGYSLIRRKQIHMTHCHSIRPVGENDFRTPATVYGELWKRQWPSRRFLNFNRQGSKSRIVQADHKE